MNYDPDRLQAAIAELHDTPYMAYVVCTGAGAGVTKLLWSVPGCSRTLVASEFPYHGRAFASLIGRIPEQHSSVDAAISLVAAGYLKAQQHLFEDGKPATRIISLGLAAAVSTDRARRGSDRTFIAIRTADALWTVSAVFQRNGLSREAEGDVCDLLAINCLLWAAGIRQVPVLDLHLISDEVSQSGFVSPRRESTVVDVSTLPVLLDEAGRTLDTAGLAPDRHVIFPGSFNPLHFGHDLFAQAVAAMTGKQVVFEIAVANADKPEIEQDELARRALQFRGRWPLLLSEKLPLFIDKARVYGGFSFILGLDTAIRLIDPRYFGGVDERDAALTEFRNLGTTFYVCNRGDDPRLLASLVQEPAVSGLFVPVPMLVPVSSSELRAAASARVT